MRHRALIAALLLGAHVFMACTSWRVQSVTPRELLAHEHPDAIQIRERGGAIYVLGSPGLEGDTLTGVVRNVEQRIALATIDRVSVQRFDLGRTMGRGLLTMAGFFVAALAIVAASGGLAVSSMSSF